MVKETPHEGNSVDVSNENYFALLSDISCMEEIVYKKLETNFK